MKATIDPSKLIQQCRLPLRQCHRQSHPHLPPLCNRCRIFAHELRRVRSRFNTSGREFESINNISRNRGRDVHQHRARTLAVSDSTLSCSQPVMLFVSFSVCSSLTLDDVSSLVQSYEHWQMQLGQLTALIVCIRV